MIIKQLTLLAFGPYKGKEIIDFTQFTNEVFMISGDTGAGKTTIFDGVCYALYGTASGTQRENTSLRNQDVGSDAVSYAEVEFSVGGKDYTVRRYTPEFKRPGEKSSGSAAAELHCPEDGNKKATVIKKNVTAEIERLIGFDRDSFMRVSVLAQGEFDAFLTQSTKERQKTLRRIFKTELYEDYAKVISEWNKNIEYQQRSISESYSAALQPIFPGQQFPVSGAGDMSVELAGLISAAETEQKAAENSAEELSAALLENSRQKSAALECNNAIMLYEEAKTAKAALDNAQSLFSQKRQLLDRQKRAEEARSELTQRDNAAERLTSARTQAQEGELLAQQTAEALAKAQEADSAARSLDGELKRITGELPQLNGLLERCEKAQKAEDAAKQLTLELEQKRGQLTTNQAAQQVCSQEIKRLSQQREEFSVLAAKHSGTQARLSSAEAALKRAEQLLRSLSELEQLSQQETAAQQQCSEAQAALDNAAAAYNVVRDQYFAGEVARLAKELKIGDTCPICGSTIEHFHTERREDIPTKEELNKSEKLLNAAQTAKSAADSKLSGVTGQRKSAQAAAAREYNEVIGAEYPQSDAAERAQEKVRELSGEIAALRQEAAGYAAAESKLPQLAAKQQKQEQQLSGLAAQQQELTNEISALNSNIAAQNKEAEVNRQGLEGRSSAQLTQEISARKSRAIEIENSIKAAAEALSAAQQNAASAAASREHLAKNLADAQTALTEAEAALTQRVSQCGFGNEQELREALADKQQRDFLEKELADYNERCAAAEATLKERSQKLPENASPRDITKFDETENNLKTERSMVNEKIKQLTSRITSLTTAKTSVDKTIADSEKLCEKQKTISQLNQLINSSGESRVPFEAYIQKRMFKGVLEEANKRLESLSGNRYYFKLRDEAMNSRATAGLDIDIFDRNSATQARRDVSTLSGGEKFLASFALAIGLSDYTLRRGAGRSANMLFIDEGFSTLSPNAADEALRVIQQLREQERTVGIITHVNNIKEDFQNMQIQVIKGTDSSTIKLICRK